MLSVVMMFLTVIIYAQQTPTTRPFDSTSTSFSFNNLKTHVQVAIQTLRKGSTESIEEIRGGSARSTTSSHPRK